jgi:acetyl-CoA synthetase
MREGDKWLETTSRKTLRILATAGEPINPEAWHWYNEKVGGGHVFVADTWWQTETGGIMIAPLIGQTNYKEVLAKAGSATFPLAGIEPILLDEKGKEIIGAGEGALCIKTPWCGIARSIYGDHERYKQTYFGAYKGYYFTGDGARRDEDGYYWITGRMDDVLNVSGHRLGTAEIESALAANEMVAEAAVVGVPHDIKGEGIYAYVILHAHVDITGDNAHHVALQLKAWVRNQISPIAMPDHIHFAPQLPKTRSGKIMRRILRKIAQGEFSALGDTSTLLNPEAVEMLILGRK